MTGQSWGGDALPDGLGREDRVGWEVVATIVVRLVPDPQTGRPGGLSTEYESSLPKIILMNELLKMAADMIRHDDFQDGVSLRNPYDEDDEEAP